MSNYYVTLFLLLILLLPTTSTSPTSLYIIRLRRPNGEVIRLRPPNGDASSIAEIQSLLPGYDSSSPSPLSLSTSSFTELHPDKTLRELSVGKGGMLVERPVKVDVEKNGTGGGNFGSAGTSNTFVPYPDLSKKSYTRAAKIARARALAKSSNSFDALDRISSLIHNVEVQKVGGVSKVQLCSESMNWFVGHVQKGGKHRCGWMLGTIGKEREGGGGIARTSLSTPVKPKVNDIVRVAAIYQPPQKPSTSGYDCSALLSSLPSRVLNLCDKLNLQVVGWIFSHDGGGEETDENEKIPIKAAQVRMATKLQASNMEKFGRSPGSKFVTLSVSKNGEAEAFQMSDVAVQMSSDGVYNDADSESGPRFLKTNDPVSVGGKETNEVDSLLCLVNVAVVQGVGKWSSKEKNEKLAKYTKGILKEVVGEALGGKGSSVTNKKLMETLMDFNVLLFLCGKIRDKKTWDAILNKVVKYARGGKQATVLDEDMIKTIEASLRDNF